MRSQIKPNDRLKRSLIKYFWKHGKRVLTEIQQPVVELADKIDSRDLKQRIATLLRPDAVERYIIDTWVQSGSISAMDMIRQVERLSKKQGEQLSFWEDKYKTYIRQRSAAKVGAIMDTQDRAINEVIDGVLNQAATEGWGADKTGRILRSEIESQMATINNYQAERIARTEVGSAYNTGSFDAMKEMEVAASKFWLTSGLPGIRATHLEYEALGDVDIDYEYAEGLMYPQDPNGSPEEIINCRCTPIYNIEGETGIE